MRRRKKEIEKICGNCKLFNPEKSQCSVVILYEGQRVKLPVIESDACFFEETYFDATTKSQEDFVDDIKEVKFWVENENGEKSKKGTVKMEFPEGYMTDADLKDLKAGADIFKQTQELLDKGDIMDNHARTLKNPPSSNQ